MDWQPFVPFIPFFASFFGVLTAFLLQWLGRRYDRRQDRKKFLKDIKHELEIGSTLLTGAGQLLPIDMWESGKASGFLSLIPHDAKTKFATIYFRIESHNYEARRVRDTAVLAETGSRSSLQNGMTATKALWKRQSKALEEEERDLRQKISDIMAESWWKE